ncbi:MAG: copper homeostasis protein CutC [Deinococcota bacterium]
MTEVVNLIPLEVCIDAATATQAAHAAYNGGAARIELCGQMSFDGLTPSLEAIEQARQAFARPGLMVMIRPRAGNFTYTNHEQQQMLKSITDAHTAGADGVVLGVLQGDVVNVEATQALTQHAKSLGLSVTFHRAFDAVSDRVNALEQLIELGVDRVLSSGTAWGSGEPATEGLSVLQDLLAQAAGRIEVVVGGGIWQGNLEPILTALDGYDNMSIHVYSGVQEDGITCAQLVRNLYLT